MPGINSKGAFGGVPAAALKNNRQLAEELGLHRETVVAVKSGRRGLSVDASKLVAAKSGEKPALVYLQSQIASLQARAATKALSPTGTLGGAQVVMKNLTTKFRAEEIDAKDPAFREAAENLKRIALAALDLSDKAGDKSMGPAAGSPNVEPVAVKSSRDAHGRAIPQDEPIERDAHGKRLR